MPGVRRDLQRGGARTHAQQFYAETYALHGESVQSEWQVHVDGEIRGENDAILDFIQSSCPLAPRRAGSSRSAAARASCSGSS